MGFQSLGWEDLLEKEVATPSRVLAWEARGGAIVHEATKSWTRLSNGTQRGRGFREAVMLRLPGWEVRGSSEEGTPNWPPCLDAWLFSEVLDRQQWRKTQRRGGGEVWGKVSKLLSGDKHVTKQDPKGTL